MAVTVEELQIILSCDASQAEKALKQITDITEKTTKSLSKSIGGNSSGRKGSASGGGGKSASNAAKKQLDESKRQLDQWLRLSRLSDNAEKSVYTPFKPEKKYWDPKEMARLRAEAEAAINKDAGSKNFSNQFGIDPDKIVNGNAFEKLQQQLAIAQTKAADLQEKVEAAMNGNADAKSVASLSGQLQTAQGKVDKILGAMEIYETEMNKSAMIADKIAIDPEKLSGGSEIEKLQQQLIIASAKADELKAKIAAAVSRDEGASTLSSLANQLQTAQNKVEKLKNSIEKISLNDVASWQIAKTGNEASAATPKVNAFNRAVKETGKSTKKSGGFLGKFGAMLKRLVLYRALRNILRSIGQAIKEGFTNAYEYSKKSGEKVYEFAKSLDSIKSASLTMKNQIGAAFAGMLSAIAPTIIQIINLITSLAAAFAQLVALFGGKGSYMKAKTGLDATAKSAGGAGGAMKGLLAAWDELNVIGNSGGGGGGGGAVDASSMFEMVDVSSKLKDIFEKSGLASAVEKFGNAWDKFVSSGAADKLMELVTSQTFIILATGIDICADALNVLSGLLTGDFSSALEAADQLLRDGLLGALYLVSDLIDKVLGTDFTSLTKQFEIDTDPNKDWWMPSDQPTQTWNPFDPLGASKAGQQIRDEIGKIGKEWDTVLSDSKKSWEDFNKACYEIEQEIVRYFKTDFALEWRIFVDEIKILGLQIYSFFISKVWKPVALGAATALDAILNAFGLTFGDLLRAGLNFVNGFISDINSMLPRINTVCSSIAKAFGRTWEDLQEIPLIDGTALDSFLENGETAVDQVNQAFEGWEQTVKDTQDQIQQDLDETEKKLKDVKKAQDALNTASTGGSPNTKPPMVTTIKEYSDGIKAAELGITNLKKANQLYIQDDKFPTARKTMTDYGNAINTSNTNLDTLATKNKNLDTTTKADKGKTAFENFGTKVNNSATYVGKVKTNLDNLPSEKTTKLNVRVTATVDAKSGGSGTTVTKPNFTVNMQLANGGIAYGNTLAQIGEYPGAKFNPEVVAPLSDLTKILEKSGSGGKASEQSMKEQNELLRQQNSLLTSLLNKELTISPSPALGQVISQSSAMFARA